VSSALWPKFDCDDSLGGVDDRYKGVAVSVASQMDNGPPNISIVSVTGNTGPPHGPPPGQRLHNAPSYHSTPNASSTLISSRQTTVSSTPSQPKTSDRSIIKPGANWSAGGLLDEALCEICS
jgi:hypothetical protein